MVRVRFDPEVAWWAGRQLGGGASITDSNDGGMTASFAVARIDAFIAWMIGFDDHAEILAPAALRERFIAHVRSGAA